MYSHQHFDVVAGERHSFDSPDVLIVEGLNVLQTRPDPDAGVDPFELFDLSIYLHAPIELLERWFVQRFRRLVRPAAGEPTEFHRRFEHLGDDELDGVARWTWTEINEPNVVEHVEPTRVRADLVVVKGEGHRIESIGQAV